MSELWAVRKYNKAHDIHEIVGIADSRESAKQLAEEIAQRTWPNRWEWNSTESPQLIHDESRAGDPVPMTIGEASRFIEVRVGRSGMEPSLGSNSNQ